MSAEIFSLTAFAGALLAGLIGALTGLGGGVIIIPLLTLGLGVDIHYAIGASLISVIATSSGAAAAYVKEGLTNIRLGMFLEVATTIGAIGGALIATYTSANFIAVIFGFVLLYSGVSSLQEKSNREQLQVSDYLVEKLKLNNSYPTKEGAQQYSVSHAKGGFLMMLFAGIISGLLGIGSGALKVLAMDKIMRIPFKVSTTTSNFMIGVTAAASAVVYFQQGYVLPEVVAPVMTGVLVGAFFGSRIMIKVQPKPLRWLFVVVVTLLSLQMIYKGILGKF
jgi:uncharacterized membrane protein YfcA